ncbi:uncharacterized protein LOC125264051 [Megalobrama amblycephala]|uniref:uncharacterized protein LOC125264051 n=1 Tax=Megalobrama amblycephala TaxID=75352 RepID=UPI002013C512|nr:uncharacterized protein LOC125264051 [Megalobrama amblycephala]
MVFTGFKSVVWSLLTVISLILCLISTAAVESRPAVSSVLDCELDNDTYICTGAQYRMYCNSRMHHFSYQRYQNQNQYQCMSNNCICVGNKDTCTCYKNTSSCFCENFRNNLTIPTAVSPVYDCGLYNDTYICTGAQYNMYCNTSVHDFHYSKNHYHCFSDNCDCVGNKDTCTCSSNTYSCFCKSIPAAVSPVYDCGLYNDTYICTGAQHRMYCNTRLHSFNYQRYRYLGQYQYECWSNTCNCVGDKDTCTCYSSTLSSCFCETLGNNISVPTAVSPVTDPDCVLQNNMYICTGAQYRMYCNTKMHDFSYQKYQFQYQYQCVNNNCDCVGNKDTCTCSSSTLSSCFCEAYGNIIALTTAVRPVYGCVLYSDMSYICTGAQYRMYCNTSVHYFHYDTHHDHCFSDNCDCVGNKDTCTCDYSMSPSCFCTDYNNSITIPAAVSPVYDCGLYNDTYICTGAQYNMYCNTRMHYFYYWKYQYQNQYACVSNDCICVGNKDTCTCYSSTLSSCFCETYGNIVALNRAVAPDYGCGLYNDTYICTGAQYHMYCDTRMHDFYYWKNQYQDQYLCMSNDCFCFGHKDTCACYYSTLSSCFCETYNNSVTIPTAVIPLRLSQCVFFNDMYICTGAQYRMHCNTSVHDFYYLYQNPNQYQYECWNNNCNCVGNKDTCTCSSSTLSSCFCEAYGNTIALATAVSPVYDCVLYNDTYICTGAQYHMYCNTRMHDFYYWKYQYQDQDQDQYVCLSNDCICVGDKDTCTCYYSALSSCFCETYTNSVTIPTAVSPLRLSQCVFFNDTYICTGAQYRMYCNTSVHDFYYLYQNPNQYQYECWNNNCNCVGNKDSCTCSSSTLSSCFCETYGNIVALNRAVAPAYDCGLYNDTYICTGAEYRMYCNTQMHNFYYWRYQYQDQYQDQYLCMSNDCICFGHKDTCTCYSSTLSSCFCETYTNSVTIPTAVIPLRLSQCVFFNDTYICTGAQYRMHCNTSVHDFYYLYQNQNQYQYECWNNNCNCVGNNDTCTCYSSTLSSCFCETYGNIVALNRAVAPAYGCVLYNDTYICSGAQYRMYCNTRMNDFYYLKYQYQDYYLCMSNDCTCVGHKDTCTCYSSTLSSCFCETYNNNITIPTTVSPLRLSQCVFFNDTYICTGAQYRMHCNTSVHDFYYLYQNQNQYHYECWNNNCNCVGNKDTCTCSSSTLSSCFCETYGNTIALATAVSPVYDCVRYNDTYICTGAQYHMYCNTSVHDFYYWKYQYQNQDHDYYLCMSNDCTCVGDKDTCTCYYSALSSCFCETYTNSVTIPTAVSPLRLSQCVFFNDTYICTGAQYRMYCNTSVHDFYNLYQNPNQYQYECWNNNCNCVGNNDTCTCYSSTLSSCFCEAYGNIVALNRAVAPAYDCVLYNDTYICTGAQYRMYCNTQMHNFYYWRYQYQDQYQDQYLCMSIDCICFGHKDTCACYSSTLSSCLCETYTNSVTIPTAVSPLILSQCVFFNDTYICTGAQYRMHCNTSVHDFYYLYQNSNQYQYECWNNNCNCVGNNDTCTCSSSTLSSCFCETYGNTIALATAVSPVYDCVRYNDTYICRGAQYHMYCNTSVHDFYYWKYQYQDQDQDYYLCMSNDCFCVGDKDTCTCYYNALSSCFCETYNNSVTIPTAVSPLRLSQCVFFNDTYICTGAQYRMYCNTRMYMIFYYRKNQNPRPIPSNFYNHNDFNYYNHTHSNFYNHNDFNYYNHTHSNFYNHNDFNYYNHTQSNFYNHHHYKFCNHNDFNYYNHTHSNYYRGDKSSWLDQHVTLDKIPRLDTTSSSVDIDLIGIAKNNNEGSAAVAFLSYNTMEHLLKPDFFSTSNDTDSNPSGSLSCVYWNTSEWIVDGCSVLRDQQQLHCVFLCSSVDIRSHANQQFIREQSTVGPVDLGVCDLGAAVLECGPVDLCPLSVDSSGSSTRSASDVFDVDSKPSTSKVSQEKHCNITLSLERVNQNTSSSA